MGEHLFISYSRRDAPDFAQQLADELAAGPPPYPVWLDTRQIQPGRQDWDDQIAESLQTCSAVLFVVTEDSVRKGSICKDEWVWGLKYKKPVIPVRLHAQAELPFRLNSRQFLDFSTGFEEGLARLRNHLRWTATPAGVLAELQQRLADAERELPRAEAERQPLIEAEIADLQRRIGKQQRLIEDPAAEQQQTTQRIEAGLERERQPARAATATPARARFVNPPPLTAPSYFQDRHVETGLVADMLNTPDLRILTVVGRGGIGKTAMVCRLLKALERGRLPDDVPARGAEVDDADADGKRGLVVDGIVYLSPTGGHPVSFPNLFADLCRLLPADTAAELEQRYQDPHQTPTALVYALLEAFPTGCTVLLLDNFEDHVDAGTGAITDAALDEALGAVLTAPVHGVKVVLTTRVAPRGLLLTQPGRQRRLGLDEGLGYPYAENVLRASDPDGSLGLKSAPAEHLATARERTRGYPRALEALAAILAADRDTTLPELLAETVRLPDNVVQALVGEAFSRLDPLAQQVMQALAIYYPTPVAPVAVDYLLQPHRAAIDSAPVLTRLVNMQFVRRDAGRYYLHQVDRDYALDRLPADPDTDRVGDEDTAADVGPAAFTRRALQRRGAEYYAQTRTPRDTWKTLDHVGPQLAEYELRCQAGDYDTAAAVLLDIDADYLILWGHYRYTLELHERLQGHLTDPRTQGATRTNLGTCFLKLGDYPRAAEHYQQALAIARDLDDRRGEATNLCNLGGCYYMQDDYPRAVEHYQQSLAIARDLDDREAEASNLGGLGDCYYMQDDYPRALANYQQALAINRDIGDREAEATSLRNLGGCYHLLGDYPRALEHYQQSLAIARDIGDRRGEASNLGGLGDCYTSLGDYPRALEHYQQALAINRDIGARQGEAVALGNLGHWFLSLGDYPRAVEHYQQALAIARDIGDREGEATHLGGLGICYADLGRPEIAVEHHQQALAIVRDIGDREGEANGLDNLGVVYADQREWQRSAEHCQDAVRIADEIGNGQVQSDARLTLATTHLLAADLDSASDTAQAAAVYDFPPNRARVHLVLGITQLRQDLRADARQTLITAVAAANAQLQQTPRDYQALDTKALALCALTLAGDQDHSAEATSLFRAARAITTAAGIVTRTLRLLDTLAPADPAGLLAPVREAPAGHEGGG